MTEKESDSSTHENAEPPARKGLVKRFLDLFSKAPDTKEALELEIQELLEEGEEQGLISSMEEEMISSILDFRETRAVEVMTPAAEIVSLDVETPVQLITEKVIEEGFTRIPIYKDTPDGIIGILHVKDLLKIYYNTSESEHVDLTQYLKPADFIHEEKPITDLLREFKKHRTHMAMVTDEFGAIRGLITLEDVIEEIIGEIDDEYDVEEDDLEEIDDDTVRVKAKIDIEDVEKKFDVVLPEGPYESIGGLMIHSLGRIGRVGDKMEVDNLLFTIKSATSRNINTIEIKRMAEESGV